MQFPGWPLWGLDLAIKQQMLLGGQVVEEDVILHADTQLFANIINVCLHISAIHLYRAGWRGEKAGQERPKQKARSFIASVGITL